LIGQKDLQQVLNKFFGSRWTTYLDLIISRSIARKDKQNKE
jgi:hypothetical protein